MAETNTTSTRKTTSAPTTSAEEATASEPTVVGPEPRPNEETVTVRLSHHLRIDGRDYEPGARILVADDYARRLRSSGYVART